MKNVLFRGLFAFIFASTSVELLLSQAMQQSGTLSVKGLPGQVPTFQNGGRSYVDVESLARLVSGSVAFSGSQITMTLPASSAASITTDPASQPSSSGFSKEFMKAGIEEMSFIREWRGALVNAVQNGYPVTDEFVDGYRRQAATNLRLASVAASTDADRSAFQLLSNEFDTMQKLSNKVLAARRNMNYISVDVLKGDPLNQQILNCARSLASMAANNQFQDDGSCN